MPQATLAGRNWVAVKELELIRVIGYLLGLYRDNGKDNGNYSRV